MELRIPLLLFTCFIGFTILKCEGQTEILSKKDIVYKALRDSTVDLSLFSDTLEVVSKGKTLIFTRGRDKKKVWLELKSLFNWQEYVLADYFAFEDPDSSMIVGSRFKLVNHVFQFYLLFDENDKLSAIQQIMEPRKSPPPIYKHKKNDYFAG